MAEINPPAWLANVNTNQARQGRLLATALISPGAWGTSDLNVTAAGGMVVTVTAGGAYVRGSSQTRQGCYACYNDANKNLTLASGGGTTRIDLIIARVNDTAYVAGSDNWVLEVVDGTSSAPAAPAAPVSSLVLAQITVGAGVSSVSGSNIDNSVRTFAAALRPGGFITSDYADGSITQAKLDSDAVIGRSLAQATQGTNVTSTSTSYVTTGTVATVTIPSGLTSANKVIFLATVQASVSIVGNVNAAIYRDTTQVFQPGRLNNPITGATFPLSIVGSETAPAAGTYDYSIRLQNIAAGSWTFGFGKLYVGLL
jgi:hypothetical protein